MKYYISGANFGNENVMNSENRPFASVEEMDQFMMDEWNKRVETDDDVYILGDFCCESQKPTSWYLQRLNGRKHLIIGNGDGVILKDEATQKEFVSIDWITSVQDGGYDHTVDLCYFPLVEWKEEYRGIHIYGYLDQDTKLKSRNFWWESATYYAGCMINGYAPVTIDKIILNNLDFWKKTEQDREKTEQDCFKALYGTHKGPLRLKDFSWIMPITENGRKSIKQCSINRICSEYSQRNMIWHFYIDGIRDYEHNFEDVIERALIFPDSFEIGEEDKEEYSLQELSFLNKLVEGLKKEQMDQADNFETANQKESSEKEASTKQTTFRVRLYDRETYREDTLPYRKKEYRKYDDSYFFQEKDGEVCNPKKKSPFHNPECIRLLEAAGYKVPEDELQAWHMLYLSNGDEILLNEIPVEHQYALTLVEYSRKGYYLSDKYLDMISKELLLAEIPFDILLVACHSGYGWNNTIQLPCPYLIENFPFHGETLEVTVYPYDWETPEGHVVETIQEEGISETYDLQCTEDGKYFIKNNWSCKLLEPYYYWTNDIPGILDYLHRKKDDRPKKHLIDCTQRCSLHEFLQNVKSGIEYFEDIEKCGREFTESYQIINHLLSEPEINQRVATILMVDANRDGTYRIHVGATHQWPEFVGILWLMMKEMDINQNITRYAIFIDCGDGYTSCLELLHYIAFGIRQEENCMELYEPDEAVVIFEKVLREAYESGRCTISSKFG